MAKGSNKLQAKPPKSDDGEEEEEEVVEEVEDGSVKVSSDFLSFSICNQPWLCTEPYHHPFLARKKQ